MLVGSFPHYACCAANVITLWFKPSSTTHTSHFKSIAWLRHSKGSASPPKLFEGGMTLPEETAPAIRHALSIKLHKRQDIKQDALRKIQQGRPERIESEKERLRERERERRANTENQRQKHKNRCGKKPWCRCGCGRTG